MNLSPGVTVAARSRSAGGVHGLQRTGCHHQRGTAPQLPRTGLPQHNRECFRAQLASPGTAEPLSSAPSTTSPSPVPRASLTGWPALSPSSGWLLFAGRVLTAAVCATVEKPNMIIPKMFQLDFFFLLVLGASKLASCAAKLEPCCLEEG